MEPARKFKIIVNSKECGTCSGSSPSAVAKKVVKKLCGTSSKVVRFSLKECKRGCERECGPYQGRMEKLDRPYKRDGKRITHRVVCGKVRKMRGGRDLVDKDFEKREDDGDFRIEIVQFVYPYVYLGEIASSNNNSKKRYEFVTSIDEHWGQFHIQEIKDGEVQIIPLSKKNDEIYKRKDVIAKLKKLIDDLSKLDKNEIKKIISNNLSKLNKTDSNITTLTNNTYPFFNYKFKELLEYIMRMIYVSSSVAPENNNNEVHVNKPETLLSGCTKYPANYKFSGISNNGKRYNTNKLFRGIINGSRRIPCKLYLYDPITQKYNLLLTELDYLVNVYDATGNPSSITYSGLLNEMRISTRTKDGAIEIRNIKYYLYCNSSNNSTNKNIDFPCWIIVKN